jgi:plasmid stabilization system protein ParE
MDKMAFELDDAAEAEFYDIVDYYKQFDQALSYDFIQEFEDAVQRLIKISQSRTSLPTSDKTYFPKSLSSCDCLQGLQG